MKDRLWDTWRWYLWMFSLSEGAGAALAHQFTSAQELTDTERQFAGDVLLAEERRHMRLMREIAQHVGPAPEDVADARGYIQKYMKLKHAKDRPLDEKMTELFTGEAHLLRGAEATKEVFLAFGEPWMCETLDRLILDEVGHVAWGRAVKHRWAEEGRPNALRFRFSEKSRLIRREMVPLVSFAHQQEQIVEAARQQVAALLGPGRR